MISQYLSHGGKVIAMFAYTKELGAHSEQLMVVVTRMTNFHLGLDVLAHFATQQGWIP